MIVTMALHKKDIRKKLEKQENMSLEKLFSHKAILMIFSKVVHGKDKKTNVKTRNIFLP